MSRTLSSTALAAMLAQETDEVFVMLLKITHASLAEPIRISGDSQNTTSDNEEYLQFPFAITLPSDDDEQPPAIRITIDNVSQTIVGTLRSIESPPEFEIMIVRAGAPDTVEVRYTDFALHEVGYDAFTITGTLTVESLLVEPYPSGKFVPSEFPALYS